MVAQPRRDVQRLHRGLVLGPHRLHCSLGVIEAPAGERIRELGLLRIPVRVERPDHALAQLGGELEHERDLVHHVHGLVDLLGQRRDPAQVREQRVGDRAPTAHGAVGQHRERELGRVLDREGHDRLLAGLPGDVTAARELAYELLAALLEADLRAPADGDPVPDIGRDRVLRRPRVRTL